MYQPVQPRTRRVQRFVDTIPRMLAACAFVHRDLRDEGCSLVDRLEHAVELAEASGREAVKHCRNHYAYWGRADIGGDRRVLRKRLRRDFDRELLEIYDVFAGAQFGAWRYEPGSESSSPSIAPIGGGSEAKPREIVHASTTDSSPLCRRAAVAGWLVEIEGLAMLLLSCELDERAVEKLERAAEGRPWGGGDPLKGNPSSSNQASDNAPFRRRDYEADVLALLLEPLCVDVSKLEARGRRLRSRTFLSPIVQGWGWGASATKIAPEVQRRLAEQGLRHRGEEMPWHLAVARAETAADTESLLAQLVDLRRRTIEDRLQPHHPIGVETTEALLSSAELMETIGLAAGGMVYDHEDYLELTLRQIGFHCDKLRQSGVDLDAPLNDTLRHTARLTQDALDALGDAIQLARTRVRWTGALRSCLHEASPWGQQPSLHELLAVVSQLFANELLQLPVGRLPEGGGAFGRIERALRQAGFTGSRLRVGDLVELSHLLPELHGVGPSTLESAASALANTLADWPSGPRWLPMERTLSQAS
ncbi:MAG: hypothetical protein ACLFVJ_11530 [Persicimonas sp.]